MKKSYLVDSNNNLMRLDRWIKNNIGKYPQSLLEKSIRKGKIKLNKKKTSSSYKLKIGDEISFYNFDYEFKPKDNFMVILEKTSNKDKLGFYDSAKQRRILRFY